jgi:hypothetical protein
MNLAKLCAMRLSESPTKLWPLLWTGNTHDSELLNHCILKGYYRLKDQDYGFVYKLLNFLSIWFHIQFLAKYCCKTFNVHFALCHIPLAMYDSKT